VARSVSAATTDTTTTPTAVIPSEVDWLLASMPLTFAQQHPVVLDSVQSNFGGLSPRPLAISPA